MVAGLFAAHGVWTGVSSKCGDANPKGWFENDAFLANTHVKIGPHGPVPPEWKDEWPKIMKSQGWKGQRWLVKAMPWAFKYVRPFDPIVIHCWRSLEAIVASQVRVGFANEAVATDRVRRDWRAMEAMDDVADTIDIKSDRLAAGDYSELKRAFAKLGMKFNRRLADEWIDPALWNRKER